MTKIEWADETWNPVLGCRKVSPGCEVCYAITQAHIRAGNPHPQIAAAFSGLTRRTADGVDWTGHVNLLPERLDQPAHWRKPRRVFVNSLGDLFHPGVPDEFIARVWQTMARCPQHQFLILTKQQARMKSWVSRCKQSPAGWITHDGTDPAGAYDGTGVVVGHPYEPEHVVTGKRGGNRRVIPANGGWPLLNVWLGVSVEDQHWAEIRIPALLSTPAAVRFLSCEPLLGPVDLSMCDWTPPGMEGWPGVHNPLMGEWWPCEAGDYAKEYEGRVTDQPRIDWVIAGGESGPKARPMHPAWPRSLRDQCTDAEIPFFFKQWGQYSPYVPVTAAGTGWERPHVWVDRTTGQTVEDEPHTGSWQTMYRVGKGRAGRDLGDGIWDEYPVSA